MRYQIRDGKVEESMFIDAPYDTKKDAEEALEDMQEFKITVRKLELTVKVRGVLAE